MNLQEVEKPETPCKYAEERQPVISVFRKGRHCTLQKRTTAGLCFNWNNPEAIATCQVRIEHEEKTA